MLHLVRAIEGLGTRNLPRILRLPWQQPSALSDTAMRRIGNAIEKDQLDLSVLLPHLVANDHGPMEEAVRSLGLDPGLVTLLARNALKPALNALRVQVEPLAKDIAWNKCECYICGLTTTLGELQENGQAMHLRCGQCGADWRFRRLQCPGCGNEDHRTRRYLYAEGQRDTVRAEVCDACRGYLKVIAAFTPTPSEMLPVEDLATLLLDHIAQERGYRRMGSR
jgi:FdhE protein